MNKIEEIKARPLEWKFYHNWHDDLSVCTDTIRPSFANVCTFDAEVDRRRDCELVANAPRDIDFLLEYVQALEEVFVAARGLSNMYEEDPTCFDFRYVDDLNKAVRSYQLFCGEEALEPHIAFDGLASIISREGREVIDLMAKEEDE